MPQTKPPATMESVAQFFCEKSGWTLNNLRLHKLLYFAQLFYMGTYRHRLFDGAFEARAHGPAIRALYRRVKDFGTTPIRKGTFGSPKPIAVGGNAHEILEVMHETFGKEATSNLCGYTRKETGAWVRHYSWNAVNTIPDASMMEEYDGATTRVFGKAG